MGSLQSVSMDYKHEAGKRIRAAREALGLTRPELASKIKGLTPSALGNYEQGIRYPSPDVLAELSKILIEPVCYLSAAEPDQEIVTLARSYTKLDRRGKNTVSNVAESQSQTNKSIDMDQAG